VQRYLIIGSGLVGRLTAWRLLQAGHQVSVLSSDDKQGTDSAGYIAAAMVAPFTEAINAEPIIKTMGLASLSLWSQWLAELQQPLFYQQNGSLVVAHASDQAEMARFQYRASRLLQADEVKHLDKNALALQEAELAETFHEALWFKQEACIDNRALYEQLGQIMETNCDWQQIEPIAEINHAILEQICQRYLQHSVELFDAVIDCRGNGAKANVSGLRSVRGEVIRVYAPDVSFKHAIRLIHPRYPLYLAPRPNHEYVLGATVIESEDRTPVSVRSGLELMSALYSLHKGFAEARVLEMAVHCRPALENNLPTIKKQSWGYSLNGLYRHGYLLGPVLVNDLLKVLAADNDLQFGELYEL
jgi:glycine oxidase